MNRRNKVLLVLCFVLFAAAAPAQNSQTAPASAPKMEVQQAVFDAGTVYRSKEKLEHAFVIKNTGAAELKILGAKPG